MRIDMSPVQPASLAGLGYALILGKRWMTEPLKRPVFW
jgi:hypothetical protein